MSRELDRQQIEDLAYRIWEAGGRRGDTCEQDWLEAERQLRSVDRATHTDGPCSVDESVKESFPASDPPSTHSPDLPPVNADAKWEAARAAEQAQQNEAEPDKPLKRKAGRSSKTQH